MQRRYKVVDCRPAADPNGTVVTALSPERAARDALGEVLFRSGRAKDLRARVYFQAEGQPLTMVRLYSRAIDR